MFEFKEIMKEIGGGLLRVALVSPAVLVSIALLTFLVRVAWTIISTVWCLW